MGYPVKISMDDGMTITANNETVTVTSNETAYRFVLKAWGEKAKLTCPGLTQTKEGGLFGERCASQFYHDDYTPKVSSFTCRHTSATGFAVGYAKVSGQVSLLTYGTQPQSNLLQI